jgi:PleD family two-component response regulator
MAEVDTMQRLDAPTIMLVALDPRLEALCVATLLDSGIRILKSRHASAACERMPVTMPKIIVAPLTLPDAQATPLMDQMIAVGAKAIWVEPGIDPEVLRERLVKEVAALLVGP